MLRAQLSKPCLDTHRVTLDAGRGDSIPMAGRAPVETRAENTQWLQTAPEHPVTVSVTTWKPELWKCRYHQ